MCNWMANPSFRKGVFQSMGNEILDQKKNLPSEHWPAHEELDCCREALQCTTIVALCSTAVVISVFHSTDG